MNAKPDLPAVAETKTAVAPIDMTPLAILDRALAAGATPETLEKLMALQERHEKNEARRAFDAAIADAKAKIPEIIKNRHVGFKSKRTEDRTDYDYEDFSAVAKAVDPVLSEHGLSYRFRTASGPNQPIAVTCILAHRLGHSEETTLAGPPDASGNKNQLQQIGSTITYLQRYTLKAALGIGATRSDDDGRSMDPGPSVVTAEQAAELDKALKAAKGDLASFLEYYDIETLADLPSTKFTDAKSKIALRAAAAAKPAKAPG